MPEHFEVHASNGSTTAASSKLPSLSKNNSITSSGTGGTSSISGGHGHVRTNALSAVFQSLSFKGSFLKKKDGGATSGVTREPDRRNGGAGSFSHRRGEIRGNLLKSLSLTMGNKGSGACSHTMGNQMHAGWVKVSQLPSKGKTQWKKVWCILDDNAEAFFFDKERTPEEAMRTAELLFVNIRKLGLKDGGIPAADAPLTILVGTEAEGVLVRFHSIPSHQDWLGHIRLALHTVRERSTTRAQALHLSREDSDGECGGEGEGARGAGSEETWEGSDRTESPQLMYSPQA